ncbi:MAG TPA: hypothetical protein VFT90_14595 [Chryseosolibacter sp.]|nr:hypothetical protein [Chryseosolibacter sp.]
MKYLSLLTIALMLFALTGCELIGDIFSAGFYTALILVGIVIAIIVYIVAKVRRRH